MASILHSEKIDVLSVIIPIIMRNREFLTVSNMMIALVLNKAKQVYETILTTKLYTTARITRWHYKFGPFYPRQQFATLFF